MGQTIGLPVGGMRFYHGVKLCVVCTDAKNGVANIGLLLFRQLACVQRNIARQRFHDFLLQTGRNEFCVIKLFKAQFKNQMQCNFSCFFSSHRDTSVFGQN